MPPARQAPTRLHLRYLRRGPNASRPDKIEEVLKYTQDVTSKHAASSGPTISGRIDSSFDRLGASTQNASRTMVSSRKRTLQEAENGLKEEDSLLLRLRNQWQFANLCQWIYLFGKVVKIDDNLDTEDIETDCLKPNAPVLQDIGLALLKFVSSHRGLTHELFDEYTRRQYLARTPEKNPFGTEEIAAKFTDFDVLTKVRILQQMTQWVMARPERVREKMEEQKDIDQTSWRIEPIGWDKDDRTYFVLDDNRVYRMTEPPNPPTPKKKAKAAKYGSRSNKRRRLSAPNGTDHADQSVNEPTDASGDTTEDTGLGSMKWECLAVSLEDVQEIIASFHKTKDDNEKVLRDQLQEHLLPILEKQEESRKRKEQQRERELLSLAKMANAKRSSRIANKAEQQKQEEKAQEEAKVIQVQRAAAKKQEQQQLKIEKERDLRLISREKRLKEREARRLQHERELSQLSEDNRNGSGRISERRLQAEIEKNMRALEELEDEEEDWIFDCICGVYGQVDDGTHSVACEKCNVWQHSKCLGISETEAEKPEFHFVCQPCKRREQEAAAKPKTTIKLKVNRPADVASSPAKQPSKESDRQVSPTGHDGSVPSRGEPVLGQDIGALSESAITSRRSGSPTQPLGINGAKETSPEPKTPKAENDDADDGRAHRDATAEKSLANGHDHVPASPPRARTTPAPRDVSSPRHGNSSLLATPIISREHGIPGSAHSSFTLPAPEGGLSPTKHSPPAPRPQPPSIKTPALPAVLPPVATLSPSPRHQILTPPIKPAEPVRRPQPPGASPNAL
ncbi:PHD-finger domain-containing protein [Colletotrichum abscissum]|uniref:PHD-finger domain-containing protein n=1 Tax=Colletotrichum abscissum TaxID=1671311 RepID=A0A9Q0B7L3_9PEZI|nr:PHD-finger domain-containing protein [Colletotrichum abscissum]KAI3554762.1 PHD-finger domain-containing protein [Colletotrichum abscissum]KAK1521010.1 PHD-finger domain-containing protein [Colletotrichum abscissum]